MAPPPRPSLPSTTLGCLPHGRRRLHRSPPATCQKTRLPPSVPCSEGPGFNDMEDSTPPPNPPSFSLDPLSFFFLSGDTWPPRRIHYCHTSVLSISSLGSGLLLRKSVGSRPQFPQKFASVYTPLQPRSMVFSSFLNPFSPNPRKESSTRHNFSSLTSPGEER